MLPDNPLIEAAALIRDLQARVRRLETLEGGGIVAVGGYALIEEKTPSGVSNITFSAIPGIYRHLRMLWIAKSDVISAEDSLSLRFNSDAGASYFIAQQESAGPTASFHTVSSSAVTTGITIGVITGSHPDLNAADFALGIMDIPYYAEGTTYKMLFTVSGGWMNSRDGLRQSIHSGLWRDADSITTINIRIIAANDFLSGFKFSLYGLS